MGVDVAPIGPTCPLSAGRGGRAFLLDFDGFSRENNPQIFRRCRFADAPSRTRVREWAAAERQNGKDAGWFSRPSKFERNALVFFPLTPTPATP